MNDIPLAASQIGLSKDFKKELKPCTWKDPKKDLPRYDEPVIWWTDEGFELYEVMEDQEELEQLVKSNTSCFVAWMPIPEFRGFE